MEITVHKLMLMGIGAAFSFALLLFQIMSGTVDGIQTDIDTIQSDTSNIREDVGYIRGRIDNYWNETEP